MKYVSNLKTHLSKTYTNRFSFGNVFSGYMDYTYFYFFNDYLRAHKLRFGIVFNHKKVRFELWLMGQNTEVQKEYWELLKSTEWNEGRTTKPRYSELKVILVDHPNFDQLNNLTQSIEKEIDKLVPIILEFLKNNIQ
nr:hypothetical protein [Apibacter adventoris]